jgi:predicted amidohydrolase YtcJ
MRRTLTVLTLIASASLALLAQGGTSDVLIINGRVFTGLTSRPWVEALSVRGNRISSIGSTAEVQSRAAASARVIDAAGRLVIPGINDAHAHPAALPEHTELEGPPALVEDPSWNETIRRIKSAVTKAPAGGWIIGEIGASVLQDAAVTRFPLDVLTEGRPVMLASWHGHGSLFNTEALRRLKVSDTEPDPPGGFFTRMPDGKTLSGFAHEYADYILRRRLSMLATPERQIAEYQRFAAEAASFGITSVQAMMTGYPAAQAAPLMVKAKLPVRMRVIDFPMDGPAAWRGAAPGSDSNSDATVVASGIKYIVDGTPVERLMFLRQPYTDAPRTSGQLNFPAVVIQNALPAMIAARQQPMFHAVGDAAIDTILAALESAPDARWPSIRPRLEHGDLLEPAHFDRTKRLGIVVVQNPAHFMLGPVVRARIGDRTARAMMVKSIVRTGIPLALGSDGPMNPFMNIMFATMHEVNPPEALSVEEALVAYTRGSAFAEFMETRKGTLAPGMLADLAILSQDIFKVPVPELPKTTSVLTMMNGKVVFESK